MAFYPFCIKSHSVCISLVAVSYTHLEFAKLALDIVVYLGINLAVIIILNLLSGKLEAATVAAIFFIIFYLFVNSHLLSIHSCFCCCNRCFCCTYCCFVLSRICLLYTSWQYDGGFFPMYCGAVKVPQHSPHDRQQDCRTLVQSGCRISKDVPPYVIMSGNPVAYHGAVSYTHLRIPNLKYFCSRKLIS